MDRCDICKAKLIPEGGPYGEGICLICHEEIEAQELDRMALERAALEGERKINAALASMEAAFLAREAAASAQQGE